jgi:BirA family biotin operon repressor/biotin-[acetyl-CoA-carboxylase] ligase
MSRLGDPFIIFDSLESTNIHAMKLANARMAIPGSVIFARTQTGGKGQRGRKWESDHGQNILMSVVTVPNLPSMGSQFALICATALACHDLFSRYAASETSIKWPNDLYWRDRKAGGILIENVIQGGKWLYAIIGIGINVNQTAFGPGLSNPVSLKQITGRDHDPVELAKELCGHLGERIGMIRTQPFDDMLQEYNNLLFARGLVRKFNKGGSVIEGRVVSVNREGDLCIEREKTEEFRFGEISWMSAG